MPDSISEEFFWEGAGDLVSGRFGAGPLRGLSNLDSLRTAGRGLTHQEPEPQIRRLVSDPRNTADQLGDQAADCHRLHFFLDPELGANLNLAPCGHKKDGTDG